MQYNAVFFLCTSTLTYQSGFYIKSINNEGQWVLETGQEGERLSIFQHNLELCMTRSEDKQKLDVQKQYLYLKMVGTLITICKILHSIRGHTLNPNILTFCGKVGGDVLNEIGKLRKMVPQGVWRVLTPKLCLSDKNL